MTYKILNRKLEKVLEEIDLHNHIVRKKLSQSSENIYDKHIWSVCLYYSLIGHLKNIVVILDNPKNLAGIFSLFRSCLDCYINFLNINQNHQQYKQYEKRKLCETSKLINGIDFSSLKNELNKSRSHHIEMLQQLEGIEGVYLKEKKKRTNVNLSEIFSHFYDLCSEYSHVGHNALKQCHINKKNNLYYPEQSSTPPVVNVLWCIGILIGIVQETTIRIAFEVLNDLIHHNLKNINHAIKLCDSYILKQLKKHEFPFV